MDMKRMIAGVCCLALCCLPLTAQKKAKMAAGAGMTDQQFVTFAAQTDMVEANLGQLAQTNASSQDVKDYAQNLVTDHTQDMGNLSTAAQQANLTVPNAIDTMHNKEMIGPFQKLKGKAFDRKYIAEMIAGHTKAIAVYKKESTSASNPQIQQYAQTALPVLEKHLDGAKALLKKDK
jgi:putative membrane protein